MKDEKGISNPFIYMTPVRGDRFVGRGNLLRRIFELCEAGQSVSLVGERRTGKTSVLLRVLDSKEQFLTQSNPSILAFVDFLGLDYHSEKDIWATLLNTLREEMIRIDLEAGSVSGAIEELQSGELMFQTLARLFRALARDGMKVVFLFDEFEATAHGKNPVDLGFYKILRNLAIDRETMLNYIIATRQPLSDVEISLERQFTALSSPLFNIFHQQVVPLFSEDEARKMVNGFLKSAGLDLGTKLNFWLQRELLFQLSGFHPFFLQMACYHLFEHCILPDGTLMDQIPEDDIVSAFLSEADSHFDYYWSLSSSEEQTLMRQFATDQKRVDIQARRPIMNSLKNRCLIVSDTKATSEFCLFSSAFARWVRDKTSSEQAALLEEVHLASPTKRGQIESSGKGRAMNPFNFGPVVPDPGMFFGREAIIGDLCTRLRNMGSTSVVGLRRIGKSSLLCQLERVLPERLGQNYIPLYVDLHDPHYRTVAGFVNTIATRLDQSLDGALGVEARGTPSRDGGALRQKYLVRLHQILVRRFSEGDLRTLCFDLAIDYDELPGDGRSNKAKELVVYLDRCGRIAELAEIGAQLRPYESWADAPEAARGVLAALQNGPFGRLREILGAKQPRDKVKMGRVTDMTSFAEMLEILRHSDIRPVLCLDEFEVFIRHSAEFGDDFFEPLRSLGVHSRLAMVAASRIPLVELRNRGGLTSPFHNIFRQVELGLLEQEAARDLRRTPFERDGISLTPEHEALVEELAGRHPFFLQMACFHLYETLSGQREGWADLVCESFNHDAESYFDDLRNRLDTHEQAALREVIDQSPAHTGQVFSLARVLSTLRTFVGQGSLSDETVRVLKRLERWGVVEQRDDGWQPFSRAFAEHLRQNPAPKR